MRERLHDYLDGELDAAERLEVERRLGEDAGLASELEALRALRTELSALPAPHDPGAVLGDRIMASLRARTSAAAEAEKSPRRGTEAATSRRSFWQVFTFSLQIPAWAALLLLLGASVAFWLAARGPGAAARPGALPVVQAPASRPATQAPLRLVADVPACRPARVPVRFVLHAPKARRVSVAGDFNAWRQNEALLADDNGNGVWSITLYLMPGRYQYKFVVDGQWVVDPDAPGYLVDGFGGRNAVLSI